MKVTVNGQPLKGDDMIAITPGRGLIDLVFTRYGRDDCISFFEGKAKINVNIEVEGEVPKNAHWRKPSKQ